MYIRLVLVHYNQMANFGAGFEYHIITLKCIMQIMFSPSATDTSFTHWVFPFIHNMKYKFGVHTNHYALQI